MLADTAQLSPRPTALPDLLAALGYEAKAVGTGWIAVGSRPDVVLLFPLHEAAGLAIRQQWLVGKQVLRSASIAAGLAALRAGSVQPTLLFVENASDIPADIVPSQVVSLQGGVVPRIWRNCFGRIDMLLRLTGRPPHPGLPNRAINAIEQSVPILQSLMRLKAELHGRIMDRPQAPDSPLRPRLTISAAHGGQSGGSLPSVFDVILSRRYDPAENTAFVISEVDEAVQSSLPTDTSADLSIIDHQRPTPDPDVARRNRLERALAAGWGWPQLPFCTSPTWVPGCMLFGGLERPGADPDSTTFDEMAGLSRSLRALLAEA